MKPKITKEQIVKVLEGFDISPTLTKKDIAKGIETVRKYGFYGVVANPYRVAYFKGLLKGTEIKLIGVVGFPLGATLPEVKAMEAKLCVEKGADELDMVINIGALKDGDYDLVRYDMEAVVKAAKGRPVKAIIETALLTDEEKVKACQLAKEAGVAYIKTCTGFGGEATVHDVELIKRTVGDALKVKGSFGYASAGRTSYNLEDVLRFIDAGADKIGVRIELDGPAILEGFDRWHKWLAP